MNRNHKNGPIKNGALAAIRFCVRKLKSDKTELNSTEAELDRKTKECKKVTSQLESLQQQLVNVVPDKTAIAAAEIEAVKNYVRDRMDFVITEYEEEPLLIPKIIRSSFCVDVEMFPGKKNDMVNLSYSAELGTKFDVTPEDVFHHEKRGQEVLFIVTSPGVIDKGTRRVLKRAKLTWGRNCEQ